MSWIDQHVGAAVRERREALAMSADELAAALELPTEALTRQELGELHISVSQLKDLTRVLGVDVSYFFETAIAELEKRPVGLRSVQPPDEDLFILSFLRTLNRLAQGHGITSPFLGMACDEVERALRPNAIDKHVGARIQHRRREIGMQREALAAAVGIEDDALRQYEEGERRIKPATLRAVCTALRIEQDYVYATVGAEIVSFPKWP
ncbi:MAG TPA: helix-turn-helix transcriptional regulator [Beijerinckiaceae bacterium]|jgi:transcriptional regulator with XRE-family HTH domain